MPSLSPVFRSPVGASRVLLAIAVPLSALALGSLHTPVLCTVAALLVAAAFLAWNSSAPSRYRLPATLLFVTGVGLTAFTALQGLPLPASVVRALSPATAEVWSGALAPLREPGPSWTSLSLDPAATRVQVLRGVTYLAAFLVALRIAGRNGGGRFLSGVIVLSAVALAVSAMLHPAFGAHKVWGVYTPLHDPLERHVAPLLNANHLAAYINIGICVALGAALERRSERLRPIAFALAIVLAATQLWVASRGGTLAMVFGLVCLFLVARGSRRFASIRKASFFLPALVIAAGVAMIVLGSSSEAVKDLNSLDTSKVRIALAGLPLARVHPFFGVGRGAYEVAFPALRTYGDFAPGVNIVFTHPENLIVQWLTEWGPFVGLAGLGALLFALRPAVVLASTSPAIGAWAALATTAVHNLVDFSSEVPAIGVALAVCAAMVVAGRGSERRGTLHTWGAHPRALAFTLAAAAAVAIGVCLADASHELESDRTALFEMASEPHPNPELPARAREALARHPSEAYVPFIAAVDAARRGKSVLPWIERTLTLSPLYGPAHFVLAQQLAPRWPAQARLEYRLAISEAYWTPAIRGRAVERGASLVTSYDDALELVPQDSMFRLNILDEVSARVAARLPATRQRLDALILKADPNFRGPLERSAVDATADLEAGDAAPWCEDKMSCIQPARASIARLVATEPWRCDYLVSRARLGIAAGDTANALAELQAAAQVAGDPPQCWMGLGELAITAGSDSYVDAAEEAMSRSGCLADEDCATHLLWVASMERRRGNPRRALTFYQRAHEKAPGRADVVQSLGELASALGMHAQALEAYRTLSSLAPDPRWRDAVDRERTAVLREAPR